MKTIGGTLKKGRGKRLSDYVKPQLRPFSNGPKDHVTVGEGGDYYVITTLRGTRIAFDMCGRCGVHVKHCKCASGSSLPRAIEYVWDQDAAEAKGEEWDYNHPNYKGSFTARETKKNQRITMPSLVAKSTPPTVVVAKTPKRLSVYIERARKNREDGVKRLLRGKRK